MPNLTRRRLGLLMIAALIAVTLATQGCSTPIPNRSPIGETFPTVTGESLDGKPVTLPTDLDGPAILLIGYVQETQFDLDRWLFGLLQAKTPITFLEVPTIPALVPSLISGTIDEGMRSGIPSEDWGLVVCLYGSQARPVREMTGNTGPRNARVMLLDGDGRVVWFHDRGFSARVMLELDEAARQLVGSTPK